MMAEDRLIFLDPHPRTEAMVYTPDVARQLAEMGRVAAHFGSRAPDALVEEILPEVSVIVGQTAMPRERLDRASNLLAILNVKANWEPNIDYAEARARGIHVLSAAPAMAPAVAEYCLAQAIALSRRFGEGDRLFREGGEAYGIAGNRHAYSLFGAKAGLVGFGNVGRALAPLLKPFGCILSAYDPWVSDDILDAHGLRPAGLDDILSENRFLFLLAGATTENAGFLDRSKLTRIQEDACVILASRAEIVEFRDFVQLAAAGRYRAAIDVFPEEPVAECASLRDATNILFTAHLAGGIEASYQRIRAMMLDDIGRILRGLPPRRMQPADPKRAAKMRSR